jgi:hypothetical protein
VDSWVEGDECELPMRRITKGRTAIAYSEYLLGFQSVWDTLPGPGSVRSSSVEIWKIKKNKR